MKKICLLALLLVFCWQSVSADELKTVDLFIRENVDAVLQAVRNKTLTPQEQKARVMEVVNRVFNLPLMAKLTLGRTHWGSFNQQQRDENRKKHRP